MYVCMYVCMYVTILYICVWVYWEDGNKFMYVTTWLQVYRIRIMDRAAVYY